MMTAKHAIVLNVLDIFRLLYVSWLWIRQIFIMFKRIVSYGLIRSLCNDAYRLLILQWFNLSFISFARILAN